MSALEPSRRLFRISQRLAHGQQTPIEVVGVAQNAMLIGVLAALENPEAARAAITLISTHQAGEGMGSFIGLFVQYLTTGTSGSLAFDEWWDHAST